MISFLSDRSYSQRKAKSLSLKDLGYFLTSALAIFFLGVVDGGVAQEAIKLKTSMAMIVDKVLMDFLLILIYRI